MDKRLLDIYSDYRICSFGLTTARGLSAFLDGAIRQDKIIPFLSEKDFPSAELESLRIKTKRNPFALKGRLYRVALASAYRELLGLKGTSAPA